MTFNKSKSLYFRTSTRRKLISDERTEKFENKVLGNFYKIKYVFKYFYFYIFLRFFFSVNRGIWGGWRGRRTEKGEAAM
jgi:hypothetical protein